MVRTVFLSSTGADLRAYRETAFLAIQKLDGWNCVRMEDFGARDWDVDTFCREKVKECDLFVGIIGHRFGDGPKDSKESYTQREYRAAVEASKPRLLFLAPDDFAVPANLREPEWKLDAQDAFRKELTGNKDRIVSVGFTNPDNLATQVTAAIRNWEHEHADGKGRQRAADPSRYLDALWKETAYIDIRGLRVGNQAVHRFRIDELYTPLTAVLPVEDRAEKLERQKPAPLQQAIANRRVVLVGDPGAGKSTFVRRIAFAACETLLGKNPQAAADLSLPEPCPFPLPVRAASLSNHILRHRKAAGCPAEDDSPAWLVHYLDRTARDNDWGLDGDFFRQELRRGALLLVDGLDEVPERADRHALARLLKRAAQDYEKTPMVATSRPPAYGGETVIPGFVTVQIAPLDEEAVDFVRRQLVPRTLPGRREGCGQPPGRAFGGHPQQAGDYGDGGESGDADRLGGAALEQEAAAGPAQRVIRIGPRLAGHEARRETKRGAGDGGAVPPAHGVPGVRDAHEREGKAGGDHARRGGAHPGVAISRRARRPAVLRR
jgi:hypothetical protein